MPTERTSWQVGAVVLAALCGLALLLPDRVVALREAALDAGLSATALPPSGAVVVVAIDSETLAQMGRWPWPRARLARAVAQIAAAKPAVLGLDLVLAGPDPVGAQALADVIGGAMLPDGDAALQAAFAGVPVVQAAALSDQPGPVPTLVPTLSAGPPVATRPWIAAGLEAATLRSEGLGVASLRGEDGGIVRRVPLLVLAGQVAAPGLAAEVVRLAKAATALRLGAGELRLGDVALPMGADADLRVRPSDPAAWPLRTVALQDVKSADLAGKIVLLGLTAPEAAAMRPTAMTPLAASVQIQADAVETMLSGRLLLRPVWAGWAEAVSALAMGLLALAAARRAPIQAMVAALGLPILAAGAATVAWLGYGLALDPVVPALIPMLTGLTATAAAMLAARKRAAALRRRFERHLSPAVVARIAADPGLARLPGEAREVTALFTDIEGFSGHAEALPPADLIAILDRYFAGLTQIIHAQGGMIEKFVGDAAHVLFNAPFDLPDHQARGLDCATAVVAYGQDFAADVANRGLGRTRVGLECGPVIVGDVGAGEKLDYTAHGRAMNLAARCEAAGKGLGVLLVAGPALQAALPARNWRALGEVDLRGFGAVALYTLGADQL